MSADLQWLLVRKYNSFIVKGLPEGPILSREPVCGISSSTWNVEKDWKG
jgi:hypothetical protein